MYAVYFTLVPSIYYIKSLMMKSGEEGKSAHVSLSLLSLFLRVKIDRMKREQEVEREEGLSK